MISKFFFLILIVLAGCKYQIDPILKGQVAIESISAETIDDHRLSNSNTLTENMDLFLDKYLINLCNLSSCTSFDTLFDYNKLYDEQKSIINLRLDLYKQIKLIDLESMSKDEKIAALINAYNFLTIETVLANYFNQDGQKLKSISDILGVGSFLAFDKILYTVGNNKYSLNTLEKNLLKGIVTNSDGSIDARFHFAVICAAKGCPILLDEAYDATKLDDQLNYITEKGLRLPRNFEDLGSKTRFTKLFDWYAQDFKNHKLANGQKANTLKEFVNDFIPEANVTNDIEFVTYDWSLNSL